MVTLAARARRVRAHGGLRRRVGRPARASASRPAVCAPTPRRARGRPRRRRAAATPTFAARRDWPRRALRRARPRAPRPRARPVLDAAPARRARARRGGSARSLDGCRVYAEKNWGAAFAAHWWWGQAPLERRRRRGVRRRPAGRRRADGHRRSGRRDGLRPRWRRRSRAPSPGRAAGRGGSARARPRSQVELEGEARRRRRPAPAGPHPGERRLEQRSRHHLLGRVRVTVRRGRGVWFRGESALAALEDGRAGAGEDRRPAG